MLDSIKKNSVSLALFAVVTTGVTAVINAVTKPTIAHQTALQQKALLDQVVPPEIYDNHIQQDCYVVTDPALGNSRPHRLYLARLKGQPVAAAIESTAPDGYSGEIELVVGADFSGKVYGTRVVKHHETPGLGDKIDLRVSDWINTFRGRHVSGPNDSHFAVKKDGGDIDQFTGATITPRAVVNAVKRTTLYVATLKNQLSSLPECGGSE